MVALTQGALFPGDVALAIREEIFNLVRCADLGGRLDHKVLEGLGGPTRVLPEGAPNLCSAVTLLSYASAGGKDFLQAVPAVAAMEMLVAAYDIIDDVEDDEAPLPDGRRSLGYVLEVVASLLMLCHRALEGLSGRRVPLHRVLGTFRTIDRLGIDAIRGQTLDMDLESRSRVSIQTSVATSALKSASLVRCCAELGALVATDTPEVIEGHARFGWHFGLMLQLMNDVAAVWPAGAAKSDLRLRKKTLPVAFALNIPGSSNRHSALVQDFYAADGEASRTEEDVKWALWRCGAIHYTWIVASREKAMAAKIVHHLASEGSNPSMLGRLLDL